ncbi:O-antigen ligase family protein [Proteiniborus sp. MB09-C3]|uniref:O-antigen ligase family protein n=1 Tax=Proteiniborus sp. MB09-C3 TaxID=3050072 RepID=UPI002557BA7A|nr:O-antigen ligase family protein [Proteiniborus sp. MB09-C3]WIV12109.1 O-antigen ligase family protein [Proteiniborus sp. MB09-C3]
MVAKSASINRKSNSTTEYLVFWGLCLLLFLGPYFRGLFFETELLPAQIFSFLLALIWIAYKYKDKNYKLIKSSIDILVLCLTLMYFVSIIYGVNTRFAIIEALKYGNYFAIYILARDLISDEKHQRYLLNTIILSAVGITLVGIGSAIGTWEYNGAVISGRISSTFQYPNTLASYLAAVFVLIIGLIIIEDNKKTKALYGISSSLMLFTFILTYSRGMWLILPILFILLFFIIPNKRKLELIVYTATNVVVAVPLAFLFTALLANGKSTGLWMIVIGLIIVSALLTYVVSLISHKLQQVSMKLLFTFVMSILIFLGIGAVIALNTTTELTLSNNTDKDNWTIITRSIGGILPNQEYELKIKYTGTNTKDKSHIGRVRINFVGLDDDKEKVDNVSLIEIKEPQGELNIPLITLDNTESLRINFDNYYVGTGITYIEASLFDKNGILIKEVPLRYKYIPENIYNRFQNISLRENSSQARIAFYKDAFKVIQDYPILGTGGGGWLTLYQMYQSYSYWTTQAHNYFLQMWIEVGIVGLALFIVLILILVYKLFKLYRIAELENNKIVVSAIFTAVVGILIHAFMDFDLSLVSLTNILWAFIGILSGSALIIPGKEVIPNRPKDKNLKSKYGYMDIIFSAFLILVIIGSSSLALSDSYKEKGLAANERQNINEALKYFEKASKLDPFMAEYKMDLGAFYRAMYQGTGSRDYLDKAIDSVDKGLSLASYNSRLNAVGSSFFMSIGQVDKALELVEKSIDLQPMRVENYTQKCDAYLTAFYHYVDQGNIDVAKDVLGKGYGVKQQIKNINSIALRPLTYNEDLLYKIGFLQFNYENLNNQEYIIDENYALDFAYYFNLDINDDGKIDKLVTYNSRGGNIKYKLKEEQDGSFIRVTNDGSKYGLVFPYDLKLEPDTEYRVLFKARGNVKEDTFRFFVYDNNAEKKTQGDLGYLALGENWTVYELDFKTDSDIEPGTQYLGFQHNGNDDGYIDLEEVIMFKK